jgi:Family of unknown function (DUF6988)
MTIGTEVARSNEVANRIEQLVVAKGQAPTGDRNTLLMAYWSLAFEFHRAILCLVDHKFYGAAFALVRPVIETTARAHVAVMGSENDLKKLHSDDYQTNFKTVGKEIDTFFHLEGAFEKFLNGARKTLHSYAHAGMSQLGRRFKGNDLIPDYKEGEIIEVIHVSTSAVFMVNNLVTKHFGFDEEWKSNTKLYVNWGAQK